MRRSASSMTQAKTRSNIRHITTQAAEEIKPTLNDTTLRKDSSLTIVGALTICFACWKLTQNGDGAGFRWKHAVENNKHVLDITKGSSTVMRLYWKSRKI